MLTPDQHVERRHARDLQHRHERFDAAWREMLHWYWKMLQGGERQEVVTGEANRTLAEMRKLMLTTEPEART